MDIMKLFDYSDKLHYKHPRIYAVLRSSYDIFQKISSLKYYVLRIFPIHPNRIVLDAYAGNDYSDNEKYIVDCLLNSNKCYELIWLLKKNEIKNAVLPSEIKSVAYGSLLMYYYLVTAKFWITNVRKLSDTRKRKKQYYIQTWHGFGPKGTPFSTFTQSQIKSYRADSNRTDIYISCSSLLTKFYREDFLYDGEVLEIGYPRYDILSHDEYKSEILKKVVMELDIPSDKKIVLYAPTFRQDHTLNTLTLSINECLSSLSKRFGNDWIVLTRLHHLIADQSTTINADNKTVFDASHYLDMQELLLVADVLITDYSSCMFDFAVTRKPCFLYHPDEKEYEDTRGFCIPPEELPFPRAHTNEDLQHLIETFDEGEYRKTLDAYLEKIGFIEDGNASKAVVDWIEKKIEEDN